MVCPAHCNGGQRRVCKGNFPGRSHYHLILGKVSKIKCVLFVENSTKAFVEIIQNHMKFTFSNVNFHSLQFQSGLNNFQEVEITH